mgnify:CR=1 FL=1
MASSSQRNLPVLLPRLLPPPENEAPILPNLEEVRLLRMEVTNLGFALDTIQEELLRVRTERDRLRNKIRLIYTVATSMFAEREPASAIEAWHILRAYAQMLRRYLGFQ